MPGDRLVPLVSEWLLTYSIHSTILLGIVAGLTRVTRSERSLERLWRIALLGPLLSTTLQATAPAWLGPLVVGQGTPGPLGIGTRQIFLAPETGSAGSSAALLGWGLVLWAAIALLGLGLLLAGHLRLARLLRGRTPLSVHPLAPMLNRRDVTIVAGIRTPFALMSGELCLPLVALEQLTLEELNAILAHEEEHVRRRDPLWLLATSVICRVLFFQPLNWIAARRLRSLAEFLCDSTAAQKTSPVDVASALASVSAWIGRERLVAAGMASPESLTVQRVKRILNGSTGSSRAGQMVPLAAGLLIGLTLFGPAVALGVRRPLLPYTIAAYDDGGPFTVTIERGRVLAMTLNGVAVPAGNIRQQGNLVQLLPAEGQSGLELTLTAGGGMEWASRPRSIATN